MEVRYAKCHCCCKTYEVKSLIAGDEEHPVVVCPECKRTDYQERLGRW